MVIAFCKRLGFAIRASEMSEQKKLPQYDRNSLAQSDCLYDTMTLINHSYTYQVTKVI